MEHLRNKRPGQCCLCGRHVAAGEGMVTRRNGQWLVRHLMPEHCAQAKAKQARETKARTESYIARLNERNKYD